MKDRECKPRVHSARRLTAGRRAFRRIQNGRVGWLWAFCVILLSRLSFGAEIADITPADTLLYVEISQPAKLWASLQNTEVRQAVRASFIAELALRFFSGTADLLCKSLIDRSLGEAVQRYDFKVGIVFSPPFPKEPSDEAKSDPPEMSDPKSVVILQPLANAGELQKLMADGVEKTLKERFPHVEITAGRVGRYDVKHIAFSRKRVWTLAFPGDLIVYGRRRAVSWMFAAEDTLGGSGKYRSAREAAKPPAGAHIFCYAEVTQQAGEKAKFYKPGTAMAGVLELDGKLVRDRIVLSGVGNPPRPGPKQPCKIGQLFPPGPWLINQVSLGSSVEMMRFLRVVNKDREVHKLLRGALTGAGFIALTGNPKEHGPIFAAEIADGRALEQWFQSRKFVKRGSTWRGERSLATISDGYLYIGATEIMELFLKRVAAAEAGMLQDDPLYRGRLSTLGQESHGYSLMTPEYLLLPGNAKGFEKFRAVFNGLSISCASAEIKDNAIEIRSVSPCGYGIWLVSANMAAAKAEKDDSKQK